MKSSIIRQKKGDARNLRRYRSKAETSSGESVGQNSSTTFGVLLDLLIFSALIQVGDTTLESNSLIQVKIATIVTVGRCFAVAEYEVRRKSLSLRSVNFLSCVGISHHKGVSHFQTATVPTTGQQRRHQSQETLTIMIEHHPYRSFDSSSISSSSHLFLQ